MRFFQVASSVLALGAFAAPALAAPIEDAASQDLSASTEDAAAKVPKCAAPKVKRASIGPVLVGQSVLGQSGDDVYTYGMETCSGVAVVPADQHGNKIANGRKALAHFGPQNVAGQWTTLLGHVNSIQPTAPNAKYIVEVTCPHASAGLTAAAQAALTQCCNDIKGRVRDTFGRSAHIETRQATIDGRTIVGSMSINSVNDIFSGSCAATN